MSVGWSAENVKYPCAAGAGDYLWHGPYGTTYLVTDQATRRQP